MKLAAPRFSAAVESWLAGFDILPWSIEATHHYAQIRAALERSGQAIGGMDMMISFGHWQHGTPIAINTLQ